MIDAFGPASFHVRREPLFEFTQPAVRIADRSKKLAAANLHPGNFVGVGCRPGCGINTRQRAAKSLQFGGDVTELVERDREKPIREQVGGRIMVETTFAPTSVAEENSGVGKLALPHGAAAERKRRLGIAGRKRENQLVQ